MEYKKYIKYINDIKNSKKMIYLILLAVFEVFDLFAISLFTVRKFPPLSKSLLEKFRFDSLHFKPAIYGEVINFTVYMLAFVFGGLLVFTVVKLIGKISEGADLINYEAMALIPLAVFILIFLIGCFASGWSIKWLSPFLSYTGGLFFYFLSGIKFRVNI